ncbi:unnamed protein product [Cylicostephanus goldi]|uniref:Uncharacterized protein n=1 Tax=Cylicostephanus goldi TaxID=71465 RepID=A0A3P6QUN5_CYLGO|nr:unnamed protein product [Cylicostephanus goldi]
MGCNSKNEYEKKRGLRACDQPLLHYFKDRVHRPPTPAVSLTLDPITKAQSRDLFEFRLLLQCCTFEGLRFSQIVGVTPIGPGEAVTGGEVVRDGRQISFDVIANIRKVVNTDDPRM